MKMIGKTALIVIMALGTATQSTWSAENEATRELVGATQPGGNISRYVELAKDAAMQALDQKIDSLMPVNEEFLDASVPVGMPGRPLSGLRDDFKAGLNQHISGMNVATLQVLNVGVAAPVDSRIKSVYDTSSAVEDALRQSVAHYIEELVGVAPGAPLVSFHVGVNFPPHVQNTSRDVASELADAIYNMNF